jgi:aspartyl-tRNA synthetase
MTEKIDSINYYDSSSFENKIEHGDYTLIASNTERSGKKFVDTKLLGTDNGPKEGESIWLRGRISSIRAKGNACFMVLRSGSFYTVQACHFKSKEDPDASKALIKFAAGIAMESVVDIYGTMVAANVLSCSQSNVEIQIKKLFVVSRAPTVLPFLLEDASR